MRFAIFFEHNVVLVSHSKTIHKNKRLYVRMCVLVRAHWMCLRVRGHTCTRCMVVAWQIHGQKRFSGLREPSAWAPKALRLTHTPGELVKPPQLSDDDTLSEVMGPGR